MPQQRAESEHAIELRPLSPALGAEVLNVDLSAPMNDDLFAAIYKAFLDYQLLLFRDQGLPPAAHVAFARRFGEVQVHVMNQYHADGHPELYRLSNVDENGKPTGKHPDKGTLAWHTDGSWQRRTGQATMLYAEVIPAQGGETHYADMYAAYEGLDAAMKERVADLRAIHSLDFSRNLRHGDEPMTEEQRAAVPPVDQPIVRTHPETKRKCLYLGDHASHIAGESFEASRPLVEELNRLAIRPDNVYRHRWRPGDFVVWDNRCLQHRATEYDTATEARVIRRCTILGDVPY